MSSHMKKTKGFKTSLLTVMFVTLLGISSVSHAERYLCGNAKRNGTIGPNARKVIVKAPTKFKAVAKAKRRFSKKGFKVRRLLCVPI
ncbi:MAG: hypothetical protein Q9M50_06430 [Methylococcales bacterium]|nr:hypothetical protein [Methylococcales bacterium]